MEVEQFRSQYHFTPPSAWMNDPNGMVYFDGEYHLFYQYYPDSTVWGPMHWGHAVSKDLMAWEHLPIALYPDSLGYIFSGSAVIDWKNSSGLGADGNPPMVAIFTYHDPIGERNSAIDFQTQGIAYSLDKGRTWTKYENNPILKNPGIRDFRDPKVSWIEDFQKWVMILAVKDHINLYSSLDLKTWTLESEFGHNLGAHGGVWECPDLFKLETSDGMEKWVMLVSINPAGPQGGSATQYFVGDFDGNTFIPFDSLTRWLDYGADNYAGVTWSDVPEEDGRRLFIGWMSNWQYANIVPTKNWRSAMTLPRELVLLNNDSDFILQSKPIAEIKSYQSESEAMDEVATSNYPTYMLDMDVIPNKDFELILSNEVDEKVVILYKDGSFMFDRSNSGITSFEKGFGVIHEADFSNFIINNIKVFVDLSSIEIFLNDGQGVMTEIVFPTKPYLSIEAKGAISSKSISEMKKSM